MNFEIQRQSDITIVEVTGQLIVGNRQELKDNVLGLLDEGSRKFLIDFHDTRHGVHRLLGTRRPRQPLEEDPREGR
jgi:hypothetical protein